RRFQHRAPSHRPGSAQAERGDIGLSPRGARGTRSLAAKRLDGYLPPLLPGCDGSLFLVEPALRRPREEHRLAHRLRSRLTRRHALRPRRGHSPRGVGLGSLSRERGARPGDLEMIQITPMTWRKMATIATGAR